MQIILKCLCLLKRLRPFLQLYKDCRAALGAVDVLYNLLGKLAHSDIYSAKTLGWQAVGPSQSRNQKVAHAVDMLYEFIARQAEPKVQAVVLLLKRLAERGEPNVRRYLAILGNPALRETVFGF